jgi:hypothetical protein
MFCRIFFDFSSILNLNHTVEFFRKRLHSDSAGVPYSLSNYPISPASYHLLCLRFPFFGSMMALNLPFQVVGISQYDYLTISTFKFRCLHVVATRLELVVRQYNRQPNLSRGRLLFALPVVQSILPIKYKI